MAVAAQVEEDDLGLAGLAGGEGLVDRDPDRVGRLGRRQDALGSGELDARLEAGPLVDAPGLDVAVLLEQAHQRATCRGSAGRRRGWDPG